MLTYRLPDGRLIEVAYDLCHAQPYISFTLKGGRQTLAVLATPQADITAAYLAWKYR